MISFAVHELLHTEEFSPCLDDNYDTFNYNMNYIL